jgi:hypothetical protein
VRNALSAADIKASVMRNSRMCFVVVVYMQR